MSANIHRCIWSFWSKPFQMHCHKTWASEKHHLLAWILSVETARRHYPETVLYTDDEGARMLVDGLGLSFSEVSTALNDLHDADPEWWVLGKLHAYRAQKKPFIHIDNDAFLWQPLAPEITAASVFTQSPEWFPFDGESWYRPRFYDQCLREQGGWMPEEWCWYIERGMGEAVACGVLGGQRADFLSYYADLAIRLLGHPSNQAIWPRMGYRIGDNILFEQYFLSACIAFHSSSATSPYRDISKRHLFRNPEEAFNSSRALEIGYTHLVGCAKRNEDYMQRLEQRVARDYPQQYERCRRYSSS